MFRPCLKILVFASELVLALLLSLPSFAFSPASLDIGKRSEWLNQPASEQSQLAMSLAVSAIDEGDFTVPRRESTPKYLAWSPDGGGERPIPASCNGLGLSARLKLAGSDFRSQSELLRSWVRSCDDAFQLIKYYGVAQLGWFASIRYVMADNPAVRPVRITLADGRKVRGVLGLKQDGRKRPLIVTRCGVFCDAADGATASLIFMHLFEESPFNVLMLNSTTGRDYAFDNGIASIAGFDEGAQTFETVLAAGSNLEIREATSEIHTFGLSLGGLGNLFNSYYLSEYAHLVPIPVRSSVSACSVVDLEPQLEAAFSRSARGKFYEFLTLRLFKDIFSAVPVLGNYLAWGRPWKREQLYRTAVDISSQYLIDNFERFTASRLLPPGTRMKTQDDFWKANRFQTFAPHVRIPTLVLFAEDDYLVPSRINGRLLENLPNRGTVEAVALPRGNHCAFSLGIGWSNFSSLLRSFYLAHSENGKELMAPISVDLAGAISQWGWVSRPKVLRGESIADVRWKIKKDSDSARLILTVFNPHSSSQQERSPAYAGCYKFDPGAAPEDCYRRYAGKIKLAQLQAFGIPVVVRSESERNRVERWLNVRTEILDEKGVSVLGTGGKPIQLKAHGRYEF